jgi:hypothetical protein
MSLLAIIATVSASDEINPAFHKLALFSFSVAGLCVLVAGGLKLFQERRHRLGAAVAALGLTLAVIEFSFAWYVRHIDFQPVAGDGTPASPSILKSLFVPFMPLLLNGALLLAHLRSRPEDANASPRGSGR